MLLQCTHDLCAFFAYVFIPLLCFRLHGSGSARKEMQYNPFLS